MVDIKLDPILDLDWSNEASDQDIEATQDRPPCGSFLMSFLSGSCSLLSESVEATSK